jgi:uncharacterized protein
MWKDEIIELVEKLNHPAWGFTHFNRMYHLTLDLANSQNIKVDDDVIFAGAYIHDIGAFEPYKQKDKDHTEIAMDLCDGILKRIGFPSEKIFKVKDIIQCHMFYATPSDSVESILFHDADTLDFMGIIGITRILSIVGIDDWTPDLKSAITLIEKFSKELPQKLYTEKAKQIGDIRKKEMEDYIENLKNQTTNLEHI